MVKQKADPINAMTRSKDGQRIARTMMISVVETRMTTLRSPRVKPEAPTKADESGSLRGPRPRRLSTVVKIGRELQIINLGLQSKSRCQSGLLT